MPIGSRGFLRVYLLDDHDIVRQGLLDLLSRARDIRVVGDSGQALRAASSILALEVDVMVLDLQLQDGSGIDVCRQVRSVDPSTQGILVTSADDDEALAAAVLAGADGFVVKLARGTDIVAAIQRVGSGRSLIDETLRARAASMLRRRARDLVPRPSDRELELLERILAGRTDREIADELHLGLPETQAGTAALANRLMDHPRSPAEGGHLTT